MFSKILVPVDGSEFSFTAVRTAASLVEKFGSRVTLIYILAAPPRTPGSLSEAGMIPQSVLDKLEQEGQNVLDTAKAEFKDVRVNTVVKFGHPAGEIINEAQNGYDLIVLGSRGLGEIKGFLMGSVSDRVSHHAPCSVMIVH